MYNAKKTCVAPGAIDYVNLIPVRLELVVAEKMYSLVKEYVKHIYDAATTEWDKRRFMFCCQRNPKMS